MTQSVRNRVDLTDFTKMIESETEKETEHGVCRVVQVRKEANWMTQSVRAAIAVRRSSIGQDEEKREDMRAMARRAKIRTTELEFAAQQRAASDLAESSPRSWTQDLLECFEDGSKDAVRVVRKRYVSALFALVRYASPCTVLILLLVARSTICCCAALCSTPFCPFVYCSLQTVSDLF